jgi:predicted DNA-binding transcriptional regulator AlpA
MNRLASTTRSAVEPARLFARLPAVFQATGRGRSTIYRLVANGAFPRPVHLGPRAIASRWADGEQLSATRAADHH